jgi:two-component system OmpR family response regulator
MIQGASDIMRIGAQVLVVEDHADTVESMAKLLELFGHEVQIARDGPQAIAAARRWRPEFILLDLGLPGMDGYEVARRLRQEGPCQETVVIAVTGYGQPEDRERSRAAGIDHHLLKPVDPDVWRSLLSRSEAAGGGDDGSPGGPGASAGPAPPLSSGGD